MLRLKAAIISLIILFSFCVYAEEDNSENWKFVSATEKYGVTVSDVLAAASGIEYVNNNYAMIKCDDDFITYYSLIDINSGNVLFYNRYNRIFRLENNVLEMANDGTDPSDMHNYMILLDDGILIPLENNTTIKGFNDGSSIFTVNQKYGYIDENGNIACDAIYDDIRKFNEGYSAVCLNDKWGFIDATFNIIIEPLYDSVNYFSSGICKVTLNEETFFIDTQGNRIFESPIDCGSHFYDGMIQFKENDLIGFMDTEGHIAIAPQFEKALNFNSGYAAVCNGNKWGLIDKQGNFTINQTYDNVWKIEGLNLSEDITAIKNGTIQFQIISDNYSIETLDLSGSSVPSYTHNNGNLLYNNNGAYCVMSNQGDIILETSLDTINREYNRHFYTNDEDMTYPYFGYDGWFPAAIGDKWGYVNLDGRYIEPVFDEVKPFYSGYAAVSANNVWGLIDENGTIVVPIEYEAICEISLNGYCGIKKDGQWHIIDTSENIVY